MATEHHHFFIGDTSSTGCFSIVILVFRGLVVWGFPHISNHIKGRSVQHLMGTCFLGVQQEYRIPWFRCDWMSRTYYIYIYYIFIYGCFQK